MEDSKKNYLISCSEDVSFAMELAAELSQREDTNKIYLVSRTAHAVLSGIAKLCEMGRHRSHHGKEVTSRSFAYCPFDPLLPQDAMAPRVARTLPPGLVLDAVFLQVDNESISDKRYTTDHFNQALVGPTKLLKLLEYLQYISPARTNIHVSCGSPHRHQHDDIHRELAMHQQEQEGSMLLRNESSKVRVHVHVHSTSTSTTTTTHPTKLWTRYWSLWMQENPRYEVLVNGTAILLDDDNNNNNNNNKTKQERKGLGLVVGSFLSRRRRRGCRPTLDNGRDCSKSAQTLPC